jgi:hypothetical protein
VKAYKKQTDETIVMLVNAQQYCAGLNLENTTDLVFFHRILDKNIEAQVAGRAQRIGRQSNLNIHYLLYNNETFHAQIHVENDQVFRNYF